MAVFHGMDVLTRISLSSAWAVYAIADTDTAPLVDKMSFAAVTAALLYWITTKLSKQLDEQIVCMRELTKVVAELVALHRDNREVK